MSRIILVCLAMALLTGCNPWLFEMQHLSGWPIEGRILEGRKHVSVVNDNILQLADPAIVAIRSEQLTDGMFDTEMKWVSAGQVEFRFRSTPYDDSVRHQDALVVLIGVSETTVRLGSQVSTALTPTPVDGTPFRVRVVQHGNRADVIVNCTIVARFSTTSPSSQWVTIRPLDGTAVELRDPNFLPLAGEFSRVSYP